MSYTIIYDRQFLRVPQGIVPLVLSGSNNCFETTLRGRERRERNWNLFFNTPVFTEADLMERTEACCDKSYQQHFMRNGRWVDDAGFRRFMRQGIQTAKSLEEILSMSPAQSFLCSLHIWPKDIDSDPSIELRQFIFTTEELVKWISAARERTAKCGKMESAYYHMAFAEREPLRLSRELVHDDPVIARVGNRYFVSADDKTIVCSRDPDCARIFSSMTDAQAELPPYFLAKARLVKAATLRGRFCLRIDNGVHAGEYVLKLTRSRLHMTSSAATARRFPTAKAAAQYAERLTPRVGHAGMQFSVYRIPEKEQEVAAQ